MRRILYIGILLIMSMAAWAQQGTTVATGLPYECSFEESENLSCWNIHLSNTTDQWIFGSAVHSEGRRSMYISKDGTDPNYGKNPNVSVAMLRYKFPTASNTQKYDVSFDWKGVGDTATSKLYVMVCREQDLTATGNYNLNAILSAPNGRLSNGQVGACQSLGPNSDKFICGSETWQNVSLSNVVSVNAANSSKNFAFLFIWVNSNTKDSIANTSIAIDNFQINSAAIKKPENVIVYPHCEDSTLIVTWETSGAANEFDIQYRKTGETAWAHGVRGITEGPEGFSREDGTKCSYALKNILEGSYDVRIRSAYYDQETSQTLHSNYVYESRILVYCPENHCVNYVDLYGPNVLCTYGMNPAASAGQTPYDNVGVVDFGPDAIESRHTLHVDPTEYDPRTDSLLKTVPDGALASVRLGNWYYMGEAESITYDITVDTVSQGILIVKYAIVFENPPGHDDEGQPRFNLEVLDQNGNMIDQTCGHAEFTYESGVAAGWNTTRDGSAAWKDWTTIGVNLMPYHGQTIKVRFTTMDCGWSGHYAYAYFTLDCANAHIETENCGNDAQVTCIAPEGFAYYWYKNDDINDPAEGDPYSQTLVVDATRTKYTCRVSFVEEPDCYFEISTTSEPRFPVPEYTYENQFGDCQSRLKFTNASHVMNKFDGYENHTSEPCNESFWTFRSLTTGQVRTTSATNPTYVCRSEGDSVEVTMTTYIGANNSCDSTRVDTIVVPNIIPRDTVFRVRTCAEEPVKFDGKWFNEDTVYVGHFTNFAGCDSTSTLDLRLFSKAEDVYIHDSICSDQSVTINGVKYNQPLDNYLIMMKTIHDCDSAIYLTLTVNERIKANVDTVPFICADDEQMFLTFDITAGVYDSLRIRFNTPTLRDTMIYTPNLTEVAIPYPDTITPGVYQAEITFYQFCCGPYTQIRDIEIRYRSSIVEQKWNDVLTVLSPKYNGGFEFTAFQWYKDDQPLLGETHSYLYQPLDENSTYYVELTRADGLVMTTCPIQPVYHPQQSEYPTIVPAGQHLPIYMEQPTTIWYYTISGQLYTSFGLPQGYTTLPTPDQKGAFIIKAVNAQGETQAQVMIVE